VTTLEAGLSKRLIDSVDQDRLVRTATDLVNIPSPTGEEQAAAEYVRDCLAAEGMESALQMVETGRANALGRLPGAGGGKCLMFNGHLDTSYSGKEPWLTGAGFKPAAVVMDGRIWGLGISNMKGAVACYIEVVRVLRESGLRLRGDLMVAGVCGEIEKTQFSEEFVGAQYRGYGAGSRFLSMFGGAAADVCILGEPTENKVVTGHFGTLWARLSVAGPFVHTAWSGERLEENSIVRLHRAMPAILAWIREWAELGGEGSVPGIVNIGAVRGGFAWRLSRTPGQTDLFLDIRVPPSMRVQAAASHFRDLVRDLNEKFPDCEFNSELFVTAPGSSIAVDHPVVGAIERAHSSVFGQLPGREVASWYCDAAPLSRYGIQTVVYGASSGLPSQQGENLSIEELTATCQAYLLAAVDICEVSTP